MAKQFIVLLEGGVNDGPSAHGPYNSFEDATEACVVNGHLADAAFETYALTDGVWIAPLFAVVP